jgi:hypothetical protein
MSPLLSDGDDMNIAEPTASITENTGGINHVAQILRASFLRSSAASNLDQLG